MFFDDFEQHTDTEFQQLMVSIAKKQNELLRASFNWQGRSSKKKPQRRGLFARKPSDSSEVAAQKRKLEDLRAEAEACRIRHAYRQGLFWWNLPWEQVEDYLIFDLEEIKEDGCWRFARSWESVMQGDVSLLFLKEEGHFSSFSGSTEYETSIISPYSAAEIDDKVRSYNNRMTMYDLAFTGTISGPVHSVLSGIDYDSGMDYLFSGEHMLVREQMQENYERTLYTEHERTTVYAQSNSRHYKSIYLVGEYHVNEAGVLDHVGINNYSLVKCDGSMPSGIRDYYETLDAAVGCAAYLTDLTQVRKVPMALFGKDITAPASDYYEALRQAKLYTCLADKITSDGI